MGRFLLSLQKRRTAKPSICIPLRGTILVCRAIYCRSESWLTYSTSRVRAKIRYSSTVVYDYQRVQKKIFRNALTACTYVSLLFYCSSSSCLNHDLISRSTKNRTQSAGVNKEPKTSATSVSWIGLITVYCIINVWNFVLFSFSS